ncbi:hypothetical protein [Sporosarcina sp. FSL K6-1508]|uniref:hypothetical protein n=1 Tax=Sporosarcina sp. FSL K6-1508 TaxID=2921553 RepID=UPI0030FD1013
MKIKNEEGYALLIVLFLVAIIMIVSTAFLSASVSNAKQEKNVDTNNLAVVAAEMGVDYYKTASINEFDNKKNDLMVQAQDEINRLINSPEYKKNSKNGIWVTSELENIRQKLIIELEKHFDGVMGSFLVEKTIDITVKFNNKGAIKADKITDGVIVKGIVTGRSGTYTKNLDFDITFKVPVLRIGVIGSGGVGDGGALNMHKLYPDDSSLPICEDTPVKGRACKDVKNKITLQEINEKTDVYFPNKHTADNPNKHDYKGSSIYFKNGLTINNNMNNTENVNLYIDGPLLVNGNINGLSKTKLIVNGSMTVNNNMKIENSTFMIRGALRIGNNFEVGKNSKVCVAGSANIKGLTVDSTSKVYVWGSITPSNGVTLVSSESELWEKCGGDSLDSSSVEIDWKEDYDMNVEYR